MTASNSSFGPLIRGLVLKPLGVVYGAITSARNKMFDVGILQQREFDIPVVVVGNIAVGGTGKTPHTEFLIEMLRRHYNIGVLSRGYNRKTKGFQMAGSDSSARSIGDEPYQIFKKFGRKGVCVAVCEDRCEGIDRMRELVPEINLIILDDAFQHRYVKPAVSIVLTEYSRPVYNDSMLPAGRLRENIGALHRADIVIVTKCPDEMKQLDYRLFVKRLDLYPYQKLLFSRYNYGTLKPLFPDDATVTPDLAAMSSANTIVAVAGVAHPAPFLRRLKSSGAKMRYLIFNDHHNFKRVDIMAIIEKIKSASDPSNAIVVTTEKDAMRMRDFPGLPKSLRRRMFYLPVKVEFLANMAEGGKDGTTDLKETIQRLIAENAAQQ